jgi:hypothetical protein
MMTFDDSFPVVRVGWVEGWGEWGQSVTTFIRGRRDVVYQRWRKQAVHRVVAKQRSQTAELARTMAIPIESVGSARAASVRKGACIWSHDNRGTVVGRGGVGHEGL